MKKSLWGLAFLGAMVPSICNAQLLIDMTKVTCANYLSLPPDSSSVFSAWMSGYFNQKNGFSAINLSTYQANIEHVKEWCKANPKETVMNAIQKAFILKQ